MKIEIFYTRKAKKKLDKLDFSISQKIVKKIKFYALSEDFSKYAKKLNSPFDGLYRFRVGDYRIIFEMDNKGNLTIFIIFTIKHRKDIYG